MTPLHLQLANSTLRRVLKRLHFPLEVMLVCVRWYSAYPLSLRNLEEMMAKKIAETFDKQNIKGQYSQGLQSYWNETKNGLESAMEGTIKAFDKYIADRQKDLDIDVEQIKERIDEAKRAEGFLRSMPDFPKSI